MLKTTYNTTHNLSTRTKSKEKASLEEDEDLLARMPRQQQATAEEPHTDRVSNTR
jgi:hypothetical protein